MGTLSGQVQFAVQSIASLEEHRKKHEKWHRDVVGHTELCNKIGDVENHFLQLRAKMEENGKNHDAKMDEEWGKQHENRRRSFSIELAEFRKTLSGQVQFAMQSIASLEEHEKKHDAKIEEYGKKHENWHRNV